MAQTLFFTRAGAAYARAAMKGASTQSLALPGIVGPALFVVVFLVAGVITPDYNAFSRFVSELSIGPLGWIQIANFIVFSVVELILAVGLWRGFGSSPSGKTGAVAIGVVAFLIFLAGVFVVDPASDLPLTSNGAIHVLVSVLLFLAALPIACFAFAWRFRSDRIFALYSVFTGIMVPALLFGALAAGPWGGLVQRITIAIGWSWLTLLALRLYRQEEPAPARLPADSAR